MNIYGQLGHDEGNIGDASGEMGENLVAIDFGTDMKVIDIYSGHYHNCVVFMDNSTKCWGRNENGQLGLEDNLSRGLSALPVNEVPFINF